MDIVENKYSLYKNILDCCESDYGYNKDSGIPYTVIWMICDDMNIDREEISFEEIEEMFNVIIG